MSPQQENELEQRARAFIDAIIKINREHGMGDSVPEATYREAVKGSVEAIKHLVPPNDAAE